MAGCASGIQPVQIHSFPANAGKQTYELTTAVAEQFARLEPTGKLAAFPEVLAFQSLVDATVSTPAVVDGLFAHVKRPSSELVLFDINRVAGLTPFLRPSDATIVASLFAGRQRTYRVSLVTNAAPDTLDVVEQSLAAGETAITQQPTGTAWPEDVFSLSHVAIPFPPDDPCTDARAVRRRPTSASAASVREASGPRPSCRWTS